MKLAMAKKQTAEQKVGDELEAQLVRLSRQNAVLRKEIARLQVYRAMAYRDPLTGLWNRRYFEERLKEEFSRSQRAGAGRKFSILMIDINDFKDVNDECGHQCREQQNPVPLPHTPGLLQAMCHARRRDSRADRAAGAEFPEYFSQVVKARVIS